MSIRWGGVYKVILATFLVAAFLIFIPTHKALAANPGTINFQGKVVRNDTGNVGINVTDGSYSFIFRLYDTASPTTTNACNVNANCRWEETDTLTVTNGVFQVDLGATCAFTSACNSQYSGIDFNTQNALYLTMKFNSDSAGFTSPTVHLTSVPYAYNSDKLAGLSASNFVQLAQGVQSDSSTTNPSIFINKTGSTANILELQRSSADVFVVGNGGSVAATPSDAAATITLGSTAQTGAITLGQSTDTNTISIGSNNSLASGKTQTINLGTSTGTGSTTNINIGSSIGGTTAITGPTTITNRTSGSSDTFVVSNSTSTGTIAKFLDGNSASPVFSLANGGAAIFRNQSDSTSAFKIQDSAGALNLFDADTQNGRIGIGISQPTDMFSVSPAIYNLGTASTSASTTVVGSSTAWTSDMVGNEFIFANGNKYTITGFTDSTHLTLSASSTNSSQGYNIYNRAFYVNGVGAAALRTSTNSATALQVQNSSGQNLISLDTSSSTSLSSNNLVTNSDFELGTSGWSGRNTSTVAQDSTQNWIGSNSLLVTPNTTASSDGTKYTFGSSLGVGNIYTFGVYVRAKTTNITTIEIGYTNTGGDVSCSTAQTVVVYGWTHLSCNFTVSTTAATSVYIRQTDNTTNAQAFYVDAVQVETDANTTTNYRPGKIDIPATVSSPLTIQVDTNTNGALQIQNASGAQIFSIDTNDTNLISNPGFEVSTTGWAAKSGTPTITRDVTSSPYLGLASLKVVTAANTTDGVKFTFSPNTLLKASSSYAFSFYGKLSSGSISTLTFGHNDNGSDSNCTTTGTINTTWQRYSCTYSTGATIGASPYIYVVAGTASQTFWIDSVQLEPGSTINAYGSGALSLNGVIRTPVAIQNATDSTTAFLLQTSAAVSLLTGDTANLRIQIGSSTTDATAVLLLLDSYNQSSDPTGVTGAMYYNTNTNKFRCYENSTWKNCVGVVNAVTLVAVRTSSTGAIANSETQVLSYTIPSNSSAAGDTYRVTAYYTRVGTNSATATARIRVGTNSLTGNIAGTLTMPGAATAVSGVVSALVTIRTTGSGGTVGAGMNDSHSATSDVDSNTATVAVDTTANKIIELTLVSGNVNNTYTFSYVAIEKLSNQ